MKGNSVGPNALTHPEPAPRNVRGAHLLFASTVIFLLALGVRAFHWQDNPTPPFHGMTGEYEAHAVVLLHGDLPGFIHGPNPPSDANVIKHPPGYPLLMAAVFKVFGQSDNALRLMHIILESLAAVFVFLIAYELFSFAVAGLSGILIALSPQLAYHSVALLPDPIAAPPLLLATFLIVRAYKKPRLLTVFGAGLMIGVSCWLRSNTLLLPVLLCALFPILFPRGVRLRSCTALLAGFLLLVVPVTIRNLRYFHSFIPLSLSAGITLVEGIGASDHEHRFGLPDNDYLVSKWEAETFKRPDYLANRFGVDGVMRERFRIRSGLNVIAHHPFWFLGVMLDRGSSMLRLARVELVRSQPAVTHSIALAPGTSPVAAIIPTQTSVTGTEVRTSSAASVDTLRVEQPRRGTITLGQAQVLPHTDYLLRVPLRIEQGGVVVEVSDTAQDKDLAFTPAIYQVNWLDLVPQDQPVRTIDLPCVSNDEQAISVRLRTEHSPLSAEVGPMQMFALGKASQTWTRYPRTLVRLLQKLFLTTVMLPLMIVGVAVLVRNRRWKALAVLAVLPIYYMCIQSALWTEFRYILSMHYFLFILSAVGGVSIFEYVKQMISARAKAFIRASR